MTSARELRDKAEDLFRKAAHPLCTRARAERLRRRAKNLRDAARLAERRERLSPGGVR